VCRAANEVAALWRVNRLKAKSSAASELYDLIQTMLSGFSVTSATSSLIFSSTLRRPDPEKTHFRARMIVDILTQVDRRITRTLDQSAPALTRSNR
jgi:hypothetical protein